MSGGARAALLGLGLGLAAAGFSPFVAEERNVREGNERVAAGDPAGALPHYDAAERETGPRPEIDYDRGVALFRQGHAAEARDTFRRALERGAGPLSSRASQNLGNALAALGDREAAKQAFAEALRQDPRNEDARFNLEVLLRKEQEERRQDRQQGQRRSAEQEQREGGARDAARPGEQRAAERRELERRQGQAGQRADAQRAAEQGPAEAERPQERAGGGQPGAAMSREQAERLLDAFRSRERALPLAGTKRRSLWGGHADRDW